MIKKVQIETRAIIFDLDDTLAPVSSQGRNLFQPVVSIARDELGFNEQRCVEIEKLLWTGPPDRVIPGLGISPKEEVRFFDAWNDLPVTTEYSLYKDVLPFLTAICHLPKEERPALILVTRGLYGFQTNKINHLDLARYFDHTQVVGDARRSRFSGKDTAFKYYLEELELKPTQTVIVGDSAHDELPAGKELGMITVQTLRDSVTKDPDAEHHIKSLEELWPIIGQE